MNDATPKKPKIKADNNPWYLLATLYGQSTSSDDDLLARNRTAWNRYMAATLTDDQRNSLIDKGRHNPEIRPVRCLLKDSTRYLIRCYLR